MGGEECEEQVEALKEIPRLLIVGAGGLGCELLKNVALSGFKDITLIDLDTIDISNLNRQFLFRERDVGRSKAEVAAERIQEIVPDCKIQCYTRKIQTFSKSFYRAFDAVIAGLDNQPAREWLSRTLCDIVAYKEDEKGVIGPDKSSMIPMIDGGTEGFQGQARIFLPMFGSCFTCQKGSDAGGPDLHMCTPAVTPRIPEHCILYAMLFVWPKLKAFTSPLDYELAVQGEIVDDKSQVKLDKDDVGHMTFMFNRAQEWATKHNISGVTFSLTQQVVKNIIPAIAATNATIAAACVNECFKFLTGAGHNMNNYQRYNGQAWFPGTFAQTFHYERVADCPSCKPPLILRASASDTGASVFAQLAPLGYNNPSAVADGTDTKLGPFLQAGGNDHSFSSQTLEAQGITENRLVMIKAWKGSLTEDSVVGACEEWIKVLLFLGNAPEEEEEEEE
jgi:ubiquitin-activating enzyme E1 C